MIENTVDISMEPKKLKALLEKNDDWILSLDDNMSGAELRALYNKHINSQFCCESIISEIAVHNNTPIDILELVSEKSENSTLMSLALNRNINEKIIKRLLKNKTYSVLEHLAHNPALSIDNLLELHDITKDECLKDVVENVIKKRKNNIRVDRNNF